MALIALLLLSCTAGCQYSDILAVSFVIRAAFSHVGSAQGQRRVTPNYVVYLLLEVSPDIASFLSLLSLFVRQLSLPPVLPVLLV